MHVLIAYEGIIPVVKYGGIQRVIWYLGQELINLGHRVTFLAGKGSSCPFAEMIVLDREKTVASQIPDYIDVAHISYFRNENLGEIKIPYICMVQVNFYDDRKLDYNTVFVSKNHANRYGSDVFVYNGMDWEDYGTVKLDNWRSYFHFLANAAWSIKNVRGAIKIIKKTPHETLRVMGGTRLNFNMGFRFTLSPRIRFHGMVGGDLKNSLIQGSKGLLLPVKWHEPFGIALTESLYFGCPVFGTPYGSQTELITKEFGFLSNKTSELSEAIQNAEDYSPKRCHEYARDQFNSKVMARNYLDIYERVMNGQVLNENRPTLIDISEDRKLPWF